VGHLFLGQTREKPLALKPKPSRTTKTPLAHGLFFSVGYPTARTFCGTSFLLSVNEPRGRPSFCFPNIPAEAGESWGGECVGRRAASKTAPFLSRLLP